MSSDYRRYTDIPSEVASHDDFIVRERRPSVKLIAAAFLFAFAVIVTAALVLDMVGGMPTFVLTVFLILTVIAWFVIHLTQNNRDLVMMTEFQNALFSSVANIDNLFLLIAKSNGTIHYFSHDYENAFADAKRFGLSSLDSLLESDGIAREDAMRVRVAMDEGRPEVVVGKITDMEGTTREVRIVVRPIKRPKGYFLISCAPLNRRAADRRGSDRRAEGGYVPAHNLPSPVQDALCAAPLGICAFDVTGKAMFIHPDTEQWLGYDPGQIIKDGMGLQDLIHLQEGVSGEISLDHFEGEVLFRKRNDTLAKAFVVQRVFNDAHGQVGGCCTVIAPADRPNPFRHTSGSLSSDATDAGAASTYLNDLLDNAPMGIALLDKYGGIVRYNAAFAALTEGAQKADGTLNLTDIVDEPNRTTVQALMQTLIRTNQTAPQAPIGIKLPGSGSTASLIMAHVPSGLEGSSEVVAYLIDTTEQKNLEEKYAHSQKMQAVGQLAGGIAHDFNNLLTAMIGFCDLLLMRHPAGDQSFADIMQIKQNANRAANLVRQLLAFSRRQTLQPKVLDVTDVLAELSDLIRRLIGENIELNMLHGRDLGMVKVDQGQFEQVIINLAVNARDAMNNGGTLTIKTYNQNIGKANPIDRRFVRPADDDPVADGEYVVVEVADNGHGIPANIIGNIFEPFFSTKEVGSGTGLGLATVYGIIKQTGGHIFVKSEENVGTTFYLYFKFNEPEAPKKKAEAAAPEPDAGDLTGKSTILLVEDEAPVRIFAARALRNKGYTILEADCAEAALEIMKEQGKEVEIIITDVIMPGLDGPSMVKEVWEKFPDIDVIFISGYAEDALSKMEGAAQEYHFLPKPFTLKQLAEKVKEVTAG